MNMRILQPQNIRRYINEFVASAKIVQAARAIDPALQIGMMLADQLTYAKTCDPQNVKIAIEKTV